MDPAPNMSESALDIVAEIIPLKRRPTTIAGIVNVARTGKEYRAPCANTASVSSEAVLAQGARYSLPVLATLTMPAIVVGLLFSGIISATMSSADSDMLGAGSIFGIDIYKQYIKPKASDQEVMKVTRISMIIVGMFSLFVAMNAKNIINLLMFSFTLRAAGAFFPYVLGHYWKKASSAGTIAALIVGSVVS